MSQNDDAMFGMFGNHFVRPIQNFVAWFAFERYDQELHSGGIEVIPRIVMAFGIEGSAELLGLGKFLAWKIFVEVSGSVHGDVPAVFVVRLLESHVVVSQAQAVGHVAIQDRHGLLCDGPLLGRASA